MSIYASEPKTFNNCFGFEQRVVSLSIRRLR